jgi:glycosyltransferase involved in cell wall biosynthesis
MRLHPERDVLLFFEDYDMDTFVKNDRRIRRAIRKALRAFRRGRPKVTGFEVWFQLLHKALVQSGRRVHVNAFRLARKNPAFPVGMVGYPHILSGWDLPNPAVLGPGLIDHPSISPKLMDDPRYRVYVTTCDWYHAMFAPVYGEDRCAHWHAGFDLTDWPDLGAASKDIDVLIYDKVRWHRDRHEPGLIRKIHDALAARGLSFETVRYGNYDHDGYRKLLARSKTMIFLCEHETQGMAYQEALASGLPILAWDPGVWVDPNARRYDPKPIAACSVPFFSEDCGERFKEASEFEAVLDRFWEKRTRYRPREFVRDSLSMDESARTYIKLLERASRS